MGALVEDSAVGGGDGVGAFAEDFVGVLLKFHGPGEVVLVDEVLDEGLEAAGVGDGAVEEPADMARADGREGACDPVEGGGGFGDFSPCAVDAGQVADAAIPAAEEEGAAEGRFEGDQDVVAVEEEDFVPGIGGGDLPGAAGGELAIRAGRAHDSQALAAVEREVVTDEL